MPNKPTPEKFTLQNRVLPEIQKTNREFLDEVLFKNETGINLIHSEPRWKMALKKDEDYEDFAERTIIEPNLFQTPGIIRDQEENLYSDSEPAEHLLILGLLADDYNNVNMMNNKEMLRVLDVADRRDLPKLLAISALFHDYHEGNPDIGDRVQKDPEFKLKELASMYTDTITDMQATYLDLLNKSEYPLEFKKKLIKEANKFFDKVFLVLASDPKLTTKYGLSTLDMVDYFCKNNLSEESRLLLLANQGKYADIADTLEMLHQISFMMSALSMEPVDKTDITTRALKFEAAARSFKELKNINKQKPDAYLSKFILDNRYEISELIETGNDLSIQKELVRNGRSIINPRNVLDYEN